MNKTVFIMDSIGNAVQWAAGMRLDAMSGRGEVWINANASTYTIHTADPRKCVLKFVKAICLCPDGSLLTWDEDEQKVVCRGWREESAPVVAEPMSAPVPAESGDDAPEGWRVLGDNEVIEEGDRWSYVGEWSKSEGAAGVIGKKMNSCRILDSMAKVWRRTATQPTEQASAPKEPKPDRLPDGRPIIRVDGHPKWRELYDDEVILPDDRLSARGSFDSSVLAEASSWSGKHLRSYRSAGDEAKILYGKAYRRIKPKKQKSGEAQQ